VPFIDQASRVIGQTIAMRSPGESLAVSSSASDDIRSFLIDMRRELLIILKRTAA